MFFENTIHMHMKTIKYTLEGKSNKFSIIIKQVFHNFLINVERAENVKLC